MWPSERSWGVAWLPVPAADAAGAAAAQGTGHAGAMRLRQDGRQGRRSKAWRMLQAAGCAAEDVPASARACELAVLVQGAAALAQLGYADAALLEALEAAALASGSGGTRALPIGSLLLLLELLAAAGAGAGGEAPARHSSASRRSAPPRLPRLPRPLLRTVCLALEHAADPQQHEIHPPSAKSVAGAAVALVQLKQQLTDGQPGHPATQMLIGASSALARIAVLKAPPPGSLMHTQMLSALVQTLWAVVMVGSEEWSASELYYVQAQCHASSACDEVRRATEVQPATAAGVAQPVLTAEDRMTLLYCLDKLGVTNLLEAAEAASVP